jgi:magnesium and cobalt exporter, CNNM family
MALWKILSILFLVAANAFFVAAEFGLVAVRRTRIKELSTTSRRAASAEKALRELNLMLSGSQLGITFASLGLGAIGEPALAKLLASWFRFLGRPFDLIAAHGTSVTIAFILITFLHVVLGEQVPKIAAIANPEPVALWIATPIRAFTLVFRPLIWLFNEAANLVLGLIGIEPKPEIGTVHTPEELAIIIEESRRGGTIEARQSEILTRTLDFPEKRAVEAMVPRVAAQAVSASDDLETLLDVAERTGFSRFPVWKDRPDEFYAVVHLKDMLRESRADPKAKVADAVREPLQVPESLSLEEVLLKMRRSRNHFAIVLDEFGSTAGILTLEDILEELVGEIRDEYDVREKDVRAVGGVLRVPGTMRPDELADATGVSLPEGEYETVAGFILQRLGRLAKRGDEVTIDGYKIKVANVRQRRIMSVDVQLPDLSRGDRSL